jgi:hypothetical protein
MNADKRIYLSEADPESGYGRLNNCTVCHGEKYRDLDRVRFLLLGNPLVPVACEFCVEEYLDGVAKAARAYLDGLKAK